MHTCPVVSGATPVALVLQGRDQMAQQLLAYLSGDYSEADVAGLRTLQTELASVGPWTSGPPEFVDQIEEDSRTQAEDEPVRTVGILLMVEERGRSPETPASEPKRLVDAVAQFSKTHSVEFEFQLDSTYVGQVRGGTPDRLLREGLLDAW